jgi:hypothetical protein
MRGKTPARRLGLMAAAMLSGQAGAQGWRDDSFPLDPPLALPQQVNGVVRTSSGSTPIQRIDRIRDVFPAVRACWRPPAFRDGPSGLQITVRLSFKRSGDLFGKPSITYFRSAGDADQRERFVRSVLAAFQQCTPLPFTAAFGSAIAGRPFTFRFIDDRTT